MCFETSRIAKRTMSFLLLSVHQLGIVKRDDTDSGLLRPELYLTPNFSLVTTSVISQQALLSLPPLSFC